LATSTDREDDVFTNIAKEHKIKIQGIQRYSLENKFNWRLNEKPQLDKPSYFKLGRCNRDCCI